MMVYRIAKDRYIEDLSGFGAYIAGGRWTLPGTYALYTASSKALAYLEFLVHQVDREIWPNDLKIATISIQASKGIKSIKPGVLPHEWSDMIYTPEIQKIGTDGFRKGLAGLKVPSAIVPDEQNVVMNPLHKKYGQLLEIQTIEDIRLDERFGRK